MRTFYITKYALTRGIYAVEATELNSDAIRVPGDLSKGTYKHFFHGEGKEWHRTWADACKRAEEMKEKKIASLSKQIKKLEAKTFNPAAPET